MELLRRSLVVGCFLPGLWLLRLVRLDPMLALAPVDFADEQRREAASIPDDRKTDAQRRLAELPLSVYVEETLQFNVFPATGAAWDRFLSDIDEADGRVTTATPRFARLNDPPIAEVGDKLAIGGGTTHVSFSRAGGDRYYRVTRLRWSRADFGAWSGFTGRPSPPPALLYPFRSLGAIALVVGLVFFLLLPRPAEPRPGLRPGPREYLALGVAGVAFVLPLVAVGGAVQALTNSPWLTVLCWAAAAGAAHVFAAPGRTAPDPYLTDAPAAAAPPMRFLREGVVFLAMAFGPVAFLVTASVMVWNQ